MTTDFQIGICFNPIAGDGVNFKKSNSNDLTKFQYYYENICVAFTSLRIFNPDVSLVLFTTGKVPEIYSEKLSLINVEIRNVKANFIFPKDKTNKFLGSLFILDCIINQTRSTLYLDPDVICLSSLNSLRLTDNDIIVFETQDFVENEDSLKKISAFLSEHSNFQVNKMKYFGGEFFFIPQNRLDEIKCNIKRIWNSNLLVLHSNGNHLQTEEHFLTLALHNLRSVESTESINRLWTTRSYRKIPKDYDKLTLIHLPAEKDQGISKLFRIIYLQQAEPNLEIFSSKNRKKLFKLLNISKNFAGTMKYQLFRLMKSLIYRTGF